MDLYNVQFMTGTVPTSSALTQHPPSIHPASTQHPPSSPTASTFTLCRDPWMPGLDPKQICLQCIQLCPLLSSRS